MGTSEGQWVRSPGDKPDLPHSCRCQSQAQAVTCTSDRVASLPIYSPGSLVYYKKIVKDMNREPDEEAHRARRAEASMPPPGEPLSGHLLVLTSWEAPQTHCMLMGALLHSHD